MSLLEKVGFHSPQPNLWYYGAVRKPHLPEIREKRLETAPTRNVVFTGHILDADAVMRQWRGRIFGGIRREPSAHTPSFPLSGGR